MQRQTPTGGGDGNTDETSTRQNDGDSVSAPIGVQPSDETASDGDVDREAGGGVDDGSSTPSDDPGNVTAPIGTQPSDETASDSGVVREAGGGVETSTPTAQDPNTSIPTGPGQQPGTIAGSPMGGMTGTTGFVQDPGPGTQAPTSGAGQGTGTTGVPTGGTMPLNPGQIQGPERDTQVYSTTVTDVDTFREDFASQYEGLSADEIRVTTMDGEPAIRITDPRFRNTRIPASELGAGFADDLGVGEGDIQVQEGTDGGFSFTADPRDLYADEIESAAAEAGVSPEDIVVREAEGGGVTFGLTTDAALERTDEQIEAQREEIAERWAVDPSDVNVVATGGEGVGFEIDPSTIRGIDTSAAGVDEGGQQSVTTFSVSEEAAGDGENIFEAGYSAVVPDPVQGGVDFLQEEADDVVRDLSGGSVGVSQNFLSPDDFQELEGVSGDWTSMEDSGGFGGVYTGATRGFRSDAAAQDGEYFGDIDWSFGMGDPDEDEVEQFIDAAPERLGSPVRDVTSGIIEASGESAGHYVLDAAGYEQAADQYQSGLKTFGTELIPQTVEGVASLPGMAMEGTELLVTGENIGDVPAAAAVGTVGQAQYIRDNPAEGSAGIVGGTAAGFGFGRFLGTTRLGEGRTGEVMRRADLDPGQRLVSGTRRGAAWARDRVPGGRVDIGDVRTGVDAPTPSAPTRVDRLRTGINQRVSETRARLPSRNRDPDVEAESIPTGRENVGTGGTGSVLDADALDEAMGVSSPSRIDLARGRARRGADRIGRELDNRLPDSNDVAFASDERGQISVGLQRQRGFDAPDDEGQVFRDFDAGRDPTQPPDAGGTFDDVRQDALTQTQDQLRSAARRPDAGDYEPGRSPFGSDRGPIYDPVTDEVSLQQSYGPSATDAGDLLELGGTATGGSGTIFGSLGLVGGALERQTEAERSEVLQGSLAPPGSEEDTGTADQRPRVDVGQIGFMDDAEDMSVATVEEDELTGQTEDTSTMFGPIDIGDIDTATDTQTGERTRQDQDSPITPDPDPDPDPTPDPDPDPDPDPTQFLTPDPDPDPDPDPTPSERDDDIMFDGEVTGFGGISSGVYTDFFNPLTGEELQTDRPAPSSEIGGSGPILDDNDDDDDDPLMGMFGSSSGPTFPM